jgi:hypothetical protein
VENWLPLLDESVSASNWVAVLDVVADTVLLPLLAENYPKAEFYGFDYHKQSINIANMRKR